MCWSTHRTVQVINSQFKPNTVIKKMNLNLLITLQRGVSNNFHEKTTVASGSFLITGYHPSPFNGPTSTSHQVVLKKLNWWDKLKSINCQSWKKKQQKWPKCGWASIKGWEQYMAYSIRELTTSSNFAQTWAKLIKATNTECPLVVQ